MKVQPLAIALTTLYVVVLFTLVRTHAVGAQIDATIVRGQAFELVDEDGQVRSRLNVEENGVVVLCMLDETGTIRLKMGAGIDGSGLLLIDDETEPGVQMLANPTGPTVKLFGKDGKELIITP
jgi:hypothetical protein